MRSVFGWVGQIESTVAGSETSISATAGDDTLTVVDLADFLGGSGYVDVGQAGRPLAYVTAVTTDEPAGTITLVDDLLDDVEAGVRVDVWDIGGGGGKPRTTYSAGMVFDGDSSPTEVNVPSELVPLFDGEGLVYCEAVEESDGWTVSPSRC
jgi:hypothetical protein